MNVIGLVLNIIGTLFIWRFGLPIKIDRDGRTTISTHQINQDEIKKTKNYDIMSNIGIGLIFLGFLFQFIYEII